MTEPRDLIRTERLELIELLETLTPGEWTTQSLCGEWTVQEVAAHLAWAPVLPVTSAVVALARAGFRPNKFNADVAVSAARRGTSAILDQLRSNAANDAKPVGMPQVAGLVDAVVHSLDIRRPLGRPRSIPPETFVPAAEFSARTRWPGSMMVGGSVQKRIRDLRLVADDVDWSWGEGQEVRASTETLMLLLNGRPIEADEVSGPGSATLLNRI